MLCSEVLVVSGKNFPALLRHEAWWHIFASLCRCSHSGAGNEVEVASVRCLGAGEEFHSLGGFVVGSYLEGKHINTVQHAFHVHEEFLTVPHIVEVTALFRVANTSGVTTGDEVCEAASNTGGSVPEHFSRSTVVHGGWPNSEDNVFSGEGTIINKGLVLIHTGVKRNIIIFAPATERVEEKNWVLVSSLDQLFTGVLEQEAVTIMEGITDLEAVDSVSTTLLHLFVDLTGEESVLVETVVVADTFEEASGFTGDQPVSLFKNGLRFGVFDGEAAESTSADLFLSVSEEDGLVDNSEHLVGDLGALKSNSGLASQSFLLFSSHVLGDWDRKKMSTAISISDGLHVHRFDELEFVHEASEGESPAFRDSLQVLDLVDVEVNAWHLSSGGSLFSSGFSDEGLVDNG